MTRGPRPSIAVIGSGLAGGLLAPEFARWARVTVFERGGLRLAYPAPLRVSGAPLGLAHTHCYGLGGTTNLWAGCLLTMRPGEFGEHWPNRVRADVEAHAGSVVDRLYGDGLGRVWREERTGPPACDVLDAALSPAQPARLAQTARWCDVEMRLGEMVETIEETAAGVVVRSAGTRGGRTSLFDTVVVAAGAINSPLLLRRSGLGGGAVGENLTDHPMGLIAKVERRGPSANFDRMAGGLPWRSMAKFRDEETGLWTAFQLCPSHDERCDEDRYGPRSSALRNPGRLLAGLHGKLRNPQYRALLASKAFRRPWLGRYAYVLAMSEQEARGQGRVMQGADGGIDLQWRISEHVGAATRRSLERFAHWLDADLHVPEDGVRPRLWSGAHHGGGCRLSACPTQGVVDPDLKVHAASRIYVCDASALPSTGASNTGLTIGALALRLAAHLRHTHGQVSS